MNKLESARKVFQETARKKAANKSEPGHVKAALAEPPDEYPEEQRGDAYEGGRRKQPAAVVRHEVDEPWEPILTLSSGLSAPDFPVDVFPEPLRDFIGEASNALPCPPDFLAVPMLTLAGGAIGASRSLHIKGDWFCLANLYTTFIATPSSKKSPAMKLVAEPYYDRQAECWEANEKAVETYKNDPDRDKKAKPGQQSVYIQDATTEAIAKLLKWNPRGLVKLEDELSAWFGELNAYRAGGKGRDVEFWLAGNSGNPVLVQRSNEDSQPIYVRHPFLAVTGPTTPKKLADVFLFGEQSSGFMERILISCPAKVPMRGEDWREVSDSARGAWSETLKDLWHLEGETTEKGPRPHSVKLTKAGRTAWVRFTEKIADEVNSLDFPRELEAFWGKHIGFCGRIALILQCIRKAHDPRNGEDVDGYSVEDAATVIDYFQGHLRKLMGLLGQNKDSERVERILSWIEREKRFTFKAGEVYKDCKSGNLFPDVQFVERTIALLTRHNYLRVQATKEERKAGRPPAPLYECHPDLQK